MTTAVSQRDPATRFEQPTRARLVAMAAKLFAQRGYAAIGLTEVLERSGVPKGSLYHYFPGGKEELAEAAMRHATTLFLDLLDRLIAETASPAALVVALVRTLSGWLEASAFRDGHPITAVTIEMAAYSERLQGAARDGYGAWRDRLARVLRTAGMAEADAVAEAELVVAGIEGGLLLARAERATAPLDRVGALLAARLRR